MDVRIDPPAGRQFVDAEPGVHGSLGASDERRMRVAVAASFEQRMTCKSAGIEAAVVMHASWSMVVDSGWWRVHHSAFIALHDLPSTIQFRVLRWVCRRVRAARVP